MPNFTGVSASPFFSTGLAALNSDLLPPFPILARPLELADYLGQDVVFDPHIVGRAGRARAGRVEIRLAHVERILARGIG